MMSKGFKGYDRDWLAAHDKKTGENNLKWLFDAKVPKGNGMPLPKDYVQIVGLARKEGERFIFIADPIGKPRQTQSDKWKKRPSVMRYRAYADKMREQGAKIGYMPNPNVLNAEFHIKMPESWSEKKKNEMLGKPHTSKPDLDNLEKSIGDIFLKKDSTIHTNNTKKIWSDTGKIIIW